MTGASGAIPARLKAIALVGGFGTRLRPLTNDTPKQMLPIAGRPMIEWVAEHLERHGVSELVLALGYRADSIVNAYPSGKIAGLPFSVVVEPEPRGTAGGIKYAYSQLGLNERCLVVNGDVLTDLDITALVGFHEKCPGATATIALQPVAEPERFGIVVTDEAGKVERFVEKPPVGTEPSNLASAGTYVLEPEVMEAIPADVDVSIERETFPELTQAGSLFAMCQDSYWLDTGTPQQFLTANLDVLEGRRPLARVVGLPEGPGAGATIHPSAQVRSSTIGSGSQVGVDATIVRSVVMDGCMVGSGAVVSDSILAPGVSVGEGAVISGFSVLGRGETVPPRAQLDGVRQPEPPT